MIQESPVTRASLLVRLRDGQNHAAWHEFIELYSPMIYRFVRSRGLQDADSADLLQDVLRSVSGALGRLDYDRNQGGFRAWLFTITRNKLYTFLSRQQAQTRAAGHSGDPQLIDQQPDRSQALEDEWEREYQRQLAAQAMETIRAEFEARTWQAFWLTAVDGLPAAEAGQKTGLSTGAVYVAKSRVLARLRAEVERLRAEE